MRIVGTSKPRDNDFVGNTRSPWKLKMMGCFNKESPSEEADFQVKHVKFQGCT